MGSAPAAFTADFDIIHTFFIHDLLSLTYSILTLYVNHHHCKERAMFPIRHQRGQGLVEYALILVLVAVVAIGALMLLGPNIGNVFSNIIVAL
jgi:pilus assembly protein Flp/PilA